VGARRKGRELAVQLLYTWDVTRQTVPEVLDSADGLQRAGEEARSLARELFEGAVRRSDEIDALISEHSENWRLSRMAIVDRSIIRVALYEWMELGTPRRVIINEALEIAKRYSTPEAVQFVNGVLDAILVGSKATSESS
jgi:N utilization substance protein B